MTGPDPSSTEQNSTIWPELWAAYSSHRNQVFKILRSVSVSPKNTICVWGAGRTVDLDLIGLLNHYSQIDLVDINPDLTRNALLQRGFDHQSVVSVLDSVDVTGLGNFWSELKGSEAAIDIDEFAKSVNETALELKSYDVVVSTCLLSQLIRKADETIPLSNTGDRQKNERWASIVRMLREQHIRHLLDHVHPGGYAVLITDLTSSVALPEMLDPNMNADILMKSVVEGNHFHGLHPLLIQQTCNQSKGTAKPNGVRISAPWIWDSQEMQYLCLAYQIQKK